MPSASNEQCYQVLVNIIENDSLIKDYICSNHFKERLCARAQNPTIISLPSTEYDLFIRYIEAVRPFLNGGVPPSLEHYFRSIIRYLVEVNKNFLNWVKTQIHFDGEDLSDSLTAGLVTANISDVHETVRLVTVALKCFFFCIFICSFVDLGPLKYLYPACWEFFIKQGAAKCTDS